MRDCDEKEKHTDGKMNNWADGIDNLDEFRNADHTEECLDVLSLTEVFT